MASELLRLSPLLTPPPYISGLLVRGPFALGLQVAAASAATADTNASLNTREVLPRNLVSLKSS